MLRFFRSSGPPSGCFHAAPSACPHAVRSRRRMASSAPRTEAKRTLWSHPACRRALRSSGRAPPRCSPSAPRASRVAPGGPRGPRTAAGLWVPWVHLRGAGAARAVLPHNLPTSQRPSPPPPPPAVCHWRLRSLAKLRWERHDERRILRPGARRTRAAAPPTAVPARAQRCCAGSGRRSGTR